MAARKQSNSRAKKEVPKMQSIGYASLGNDADIDYAKASAGSQTTRTRRNRAATIERSDKYKNIKEGIIPFKRSNSNYSSGTSIDLSEAIELCQRAYYNVSVFRNTIDLMAEFSSDEIYLTGGTKKSKDFINAWLKKINIWDLQDQFFREYYRSGNVFLFRYDTELLKSDILKIVNVFGSKEAKAATELSIPSKYVILNPVDVEVDDSVSFADGKFHKRLTDYEVMVLKNHRKDYEEAMDVYNSLPKEIQDKIDKHKGGELIRIELPPEKVKAVFYKKQDYEPFAIPMGFPVLEDINWKMELKKVDMAISRTVQQAILLVTIGNDEIGVNQDHISALQSIFLNESVGRVLVSDYTTEAQFVIPEIASILDPKKYEIVDRDIKLGLNNIIIGEEKFSSTTVKAQIFIERLRQAREAFLNNFLIPEIKRLSKVMGFKTFPTPKFVEIRLSDDRDLVRSIVRLIELGILTAEEGIEAIETGRLPSNEESLESQQQYKSLRDKGLYEPMIGGKKDDVGRPGGTKEGGRDKSGNKQTPAGGSVEDFYSISKIKAAFGEYVKCGNSTAKFYKKANKKKTLSDQDRLNIESISSIIMVNETSDKWADEKVIEKYVKAPTDKNLEMVRQVEEIAAYHQLEPHLAAILNASILEDNEKPNNL